MKTSDRGFKHMDPIWGTYGGNVRVYESSNAAGPHVWINADEQAQGNQDGSWTQGDRSQAIHLTMEDVRNLRDQLTYLLDNHYQVKESDG